jgi:hypothetical protein
MIKSLLAPWILAVCCLIVFCNVSYSQPSVDLTQSHSLEYDLDYRVWYDKSGVFSVTGKFESFQGELVRIRRKDNGKLVDVPIDKLSEADQQTIERIRQHLTLEAKKRVFANLVMGLEDFYQAAKELANKSDAIRNDDSLTTALRAAMTEKAYQKFKSAISGKKLSWVVAIDDVMSASKGFVALQTSNVYEGSISARLSSVMVDLKKYPLETLRKGDVYLLECKLSPSSSGDNLLVFADQLNINELLANGNPIPDVAVRFGVEVIELHKVEPADTDNLKLAIKWFREKFERVSSE